MHPGHLLYSLVLCLRAPVAAGTSSDRPDILTNINALDSRAGEASLSSLPASVSTGPAASSDPDATPVTPLKPDPTLSRVDDRGMNTDVSTESGKPMTSKERGAKASHTEFSPDLPTGGVNMLTPAPNVEPTPLYKIRDHVTWGWNYTALLGTPTAVDVLVSCSFASETWTLTNNMSFSTSVEYIWDTNLQADSVTKPLLTQMYTLIVKDAGADISAISEPGYLGIFKGFTFGLYSPQPYTPYPDWTCTGCSKALPLFDRHALVLATSMSIVTFFSFTWFVAGLDLH